MCLNLLSHHPPLQPQLSMEPLYKLLRRSIHVAAIHGSDAASYVGKHGRCTVSFPRNLRQRVVSDIRVALAFVDKRFARPTASSVGGGRGVGTSRWGAAAAEFVVELEGYRRDEGGSDIVVVGGTASDVGVGS